MERIKVYKEMYQKGMRVKLLYMNDPYSVPNGTEGTINFVDDMGTIHVNWDNGSTLGLIIGEDQFELI